MPVITAATLRTYNVVGLTGTDEDSYLDGLIDRADAALAARLGFPPASAGGSPTLASATFTHYLHGPDPLDETVLRLPVRPVTSVTSVHQSLIWTYDSSTLVASTDYTLDGVHGAITLNPDASTTWLAGRRVLKVVYAAGWSTLPDDLAQAVGQLARHWHDLRSTQGHDALSVQGRSETVAGPQIPQHVLQLIAPHRCPEVAYAA